ncbi:MAG TPA: hypothetical protein VHB97_05300 [Polyangia bacterium]|nr:hypothetical protein [Polyangia bacterium]
MTSDIGDGQAARAVILLAPVAQVVTVTATAHLTDGSAPSLTRTVESVPQHQIVLALAFAGDDGGVATDLGVTPIDLAGGSASIDLATQRDLGQSPDMTTFIARDTFVRPDQALWGIASDGQTWGADANTASNFSIAGNAGVVANTGLTSFQAVLGPSTVTDADVRVQVAMTAVDQSQNGGPVIRRVDGANFYKAFIDGLNFVLQKRVASTFTVLQMVSFALTASQFYWIRFQATGTQLRAKVWPVGTSEPAAWMVDQTDTSLTMGNVGVRMQSNDTTGSVQFRELMAQ